MLNPNTPLVSHGRSLSDPIFYNIERDVELLPLDTQISHSITEFFTGSLSIKLYRQSHADQVVSYLGTAAIEMLRKSTAAEKNFRVVKYSGGSWDYTPILERGGETYVTTVPSEFRWRAKYELAISLIKILTELDSFRLSLPVVKNTTNLKMAREMLQAGADVDQSFYQPGYRARGQILHREEHMVYLALSRLSTLKSLAFVRAQELLKKV